MKWVKRNGLWIAAGALAVALIALGLVGVVWSVIPSFEGSRSLTSNKSSTTQSSTIQTVGIKIPDKQVVGVKVPNGSGEVDVPNVEVEIPNALFDRLQPSLDKPEPSHDSARAALAAPSVAAVAAGVSILVALIALSGVWKTVADKWHNDQLDALWDRFTWVVDTSRAKLLNHEDRREILRALENSAKKLEDEDLAAVICEWRKVSLDSKYDEVWKAAQNAITVLRTIRDDGSQPLSVRRQAEESMNTLQSLIPPPPMNNGQTAPPPISVQATPAGVQQNMLRSRETAEPIMDEASATALAGTNQTVQTQRNRVRGLITQTVGDIADGIRRRVYDHAKKIADEYTGTTTKLGKYGLTQLLNDLDEAAFALADELRINETQIDWRADPSPTAMFKFLHSRVRRFDAIFEGRGYKIEPRDALDPYSLFDREGLDELERELVRLFALENAVQLVDAVAARVQVDSLWSDATDASDQS